MSNDKDYFKKLEEQLRQREEQARRIREEELRRIKDNEERQRRIDESVKKGRPIDTRPGKDD